MHAFILFVIIQSLHAFPFKRKMHRLLFVKNGGSEKLQERPFYHPKPNYETIERDTTDNDNSASSNMEEVKENLKYGFNYALQKLSIGQKELNVTSFFTDSAHVTHIYFKHLLHGVEIHNHHAAIHVRRKQVLAFSSSFNQPNHLKKRDATIYPASNIITDKDAIEICKNELEIENCIAVSQKYIEIPSGSLIFTHVVKCRSFLNSVQAYVDGVNGQIVHIDDFISSASYKVVDFKNSKPLTFTVAENPFLKNASPKGWHSAKGEFTETQGNNARVYAVSRKENKRYFSQGGQNLEFLHNFEPNDLPTQGSNRDVSITNLFYICNMMHDLSFQYVFFN
jgi:hypothetical protein